MKLTFTTKGPKLAHDHPQDPNNHTKSLMKDFDKVKQWLQENQDQCSDSLKQGLRSQVTLGIRQGVASGIDNMSEDIWKSVDEEFVKGVVDREITKALSKGLSIGIPKPLFDQLYESYTSLNGKWTAKDVSAEGYGPPLRQRVTRTISKTSSTCDLPKTATGHHSEQVSWSDDGGPRGSPREPSKESGASTALSEEPNEEFADRCCVCNTPASEEELITTTCCSRFVGSLCFEEALQETSKCCLCHQPQSPFESSRFTENSEHGLDYMYHFVGDQSRPDSSIKVEPAVDNTNPSETSITYPSPVQFPSSPPEKPVEPVSLVRETTEWTVQFSDGYEPKGKTARSKRPLSNLSTKPNHKSQSMSVQENLQHLDPLEQGPLSSGTTTTCVLKLFDQAVISYLKELSSEELLPTVYEALKPRLPSTVYVVIFFGALILEGGHVQIMYGINQGQAPDWKGDTASWAETLENFVRARSATYSVVMHNVEIESMNLSDENYKSRAIEELVGINASAMQTLSRPDDIRFIRWNMGRKNLRQAQIGSIKMGLSTAAQANEVIARGLLWREQRRYCVKEGPKRKMFQCDNCQGFGHTAENCSHPSRCQLCAEAHPANECPLGLAPESRSLKCALCGDRHSARDYFCTVKRGEEERLRLENRCYPTDMDDMLAASEEAKTKPSPAPTMSSTPIPATPSAHSPKKDSYPKIGKPTPVEEQRSPFADFDEQIILQQPDGSRYLVPATRIESRVGGP